jgi:hypothetical protein
MKRSFVKFLSDETGATAIEYGQSQPAFRLRSVCRGQRPWHEPQCEVRLSQQLAEVRAKLEKLLTEAEDCELIGMLATDVKKRELFKKLAVDLRAMAHDIQSMIGARRSAVRVHVFLPDCESTCAHRW